MPISPQKTGATLRNAAKIVQIRAIPRFAVPAMPTKQNNVAAVRPWLNICRNTPLSAAAFSQRHAIREVATAKIRAGNSRDD